jgi:hypothetical protein
MTMDPDRWIALARFHQELFAKRQVQEWAICFTVWGGVGSLTIAATASTHTGWIEGVLPSLPLYYLAIWSGASVALFWIHKNHAIDRRKKYVYLKRATPRILGGRAMLLGTAARAARDERLDTMRWFALQVAATALGMCMSIQVLARSIHEQPLPVRRPGQ